jgi:hypothetical protein
VRLAVLADVHGNLRALEAVLADVARHAPDAVVDLGDCVAGPLQAADTADLLMGRGFVTVRGNHDRQLVELAPRPWAPPTARPTRSCCRATAPGWPPSRHRGRRRRAVLPRHPSDDLAYLLEAVTPTAP